MLEKILNQKALLSTILLAVFIGGIAAYLNIGKLEDAEISVKTAVVITPYPGATAHEVELEVTDVLEKAIQRLENIDDIESRSLPGMSEITVNIKTSVKNDELPQLWDHLRRKINDVKSNLPKGAMKPVVNDDFGDTYGIYLAVTSDGFLYNELEDYTNYLKRRLLEIEGIRRIEIYGKQTETVEIRFSPEKLAGLGVNPLLIVQTMNDQGGVVNPGDLVSGTERIRLSVGNKFSSLEEVEDLLIQVPQGGNFRLGDITTIERSFYSPKREGLTYNGQPALSMAVSMGKGVNVVEIGEVVDARLEELKKDIPIGIEVHSVFSQPDRVSESINGFVTNLIMSVVIVIVVLLFSMGFRSGLLISSGLVFTILATLIAMLMFDMQLHRITLAAIIIAMGMLVDNSIVVADGILIDLKKGMKRKAAFTDAVKKSALPLLGATIVAILAFMPLAMSPDAAGEYLSSLFYVLCISLFLSWIFAMVQTPFMAKWFYRKKAKGEHSAEDPFSGKVYVYFKKAIKWSLSHKTAFLATSVLILVISLYSFRFVRFKFMPALDYNQFVLEYYLPQGSDIDQVEKDIHELSDELLQWDEVVNVTTALGRTPARYTLLRPMNNQNANYGELIIDVEDYDTYVEVSPKITAYVRKNYPQAEARIRIYGPIFSKYEIEAQFTGPDPVVLRQLAEQAKVVMRNEPTVAMVTDDWKNKTKVLSPVYSVEQARRLSISRNDLAHSMAIATNGLPVGIIQQGDDGLPIVLKLDNQINKNVNQINSIPVWGQRPSSVPMGQVIEDIELGWEDMQINRYNGQRAIRAQCDPASGYLTDQVQAILQPQIEAIVLPDGYALEWKGTVADSAESQRNLFKFLPLAVGLMLLIIIGLFNNFKQPVIIFAIVPFALIGIVLGFVTTGANLTFVGIIGALGLIGMMIKNSVVLLDEINIELREGKSKIDAIVNSTVSRMRPVFMASATTVLGMLPLVTDVMFQSLAITIIFGLLVGTLITLFVVPVMYAVLYRVDTRSLKEKRVSN